MILVTKKCRIYADCGVSQMPKEYQIQRGDFDTVKECQYSVLTFTSIGRVYQELVSSVCENKDVPQTIIDVFSSFISDEISNSNVYYSNQDYLRCSLLEGEMLA